MDEPVTWWGPPCGFILLRVSSEPSGAKREPLRGKDLAWTSSTLFAEGLPWSVLHQIAGEYLTAIGVSATQIGRTSYLHAGTSFKVLWSPIVDAFGALRTWMIAMQGAMGVAMGLLAVLADRLARAGGHEPDATSIWIVLAIIGLLSAVHDIACDGYYMDALSKRDQARYSGVRVAAFRAALIVGSSGLVFLGGTVSWLAAFGTAAAIMFGLAAAHRVFLPRGASESAASSGVRRAQKAAPWAHIQDAYRSFLAQDRLFVVIAFLLTYKLADVVMLNMSKVLLARELGVTTDMRGIVNAFSFTASIVGAIMGGAWIARRSLAAALLPITILMAITEPLYVVLAAWAPDLAVATPGTIETMDQIDFQAAWWRMGIIGGVVVIEMVCGGMATAAQMVFIMRRCHPDHKAAHFAFATAIYSTAQMIVGGESGQIYDTLGHVGYFWFASALTIPAVILARFVPKDA